MKQIKLNQPHVHAGISYAAGDVIEVTDSDAGISSVIKLA